MKIEIRVYGMLRDKLPAGSNGKTILELNDESSVADALSALDISSQVKVSINEVLERDFNHILHNGDTLQIFRPVGGG